MLLDKIVAFREHVKEAANNPDFLHYKWFVQWHLEVVEKIASELCEHYADADREMVEVMVWLHDYGKIIDFEHAYTATQEHGTKILAQLGFDPKFAETVLKGIEMLDRKNEIDLHQAPIEVQIVSSADGCSHLVGPFLHIFWNEATDKTFAGKTYVELMHLNRTKAEKDWDRKIVLPEARQAFEARYKFILEQTGVLPARYV